MKYLEFSKPADTYSAYPQTAILYSEPPPYGEEIDRIAGATAPNPLIPGSPDRPNLSEYPIVHPGTYIGIFYPDRHHGRPCIAIHDDGPVWILQDKNPRTGAKRSAVGIRVHEGYSASWRGSAGCMTLRSPGGDAWLLKNFLEGERIAVYIPNQDWFSRK